MADDIHTPFGTIATTDTAGVHTLQVELASSSADGVHNEDAAHTTGDPGVQVLARWAASEAQSAGASGDYCTLNSDAYGDLYVHQGFSWAISVVRGTVAVAGTAEQLAGGASLRNGGCLRAEPSNTGNVYLGGSDVDSTNGYILQPGDVLDLRNILNTSYLYADVDVSGDGFCIYRTN